MKYISNEILFQSCEHVIPENVVWHSSGFRTRRRQMFSTFKISNL